ncbi:cation diffusion facilitator family transporter [Salinithrix halophila]|uniref:Cation diffusion facilitator family transporter n=1 Tax=Salinithrix halophila TaxID=1485204 RepID=A0ABV8JBZ1_9BACL
MKNQAESGAWVSIGAYILLSLFKISMGLYTGSQALTADGLNNVTDIIASTGVLIGLKISRKPRDDDHPYGHSRAESISALIASFIMATIGLQVLGDAIQSAWLGQAIAPNALAAAVALVSALVMFGVYAFNRRLADKTNSHALSAVSKDNLSDALISIGAAVGIIGSQFGMPWLDPVAAVIVSFLILKTAWEIFAEMSHLLTDGFQPKRLVQYRETMEQTDGVLAVVDLKGRMQGHDIILDAVIEMDARLSVEESHQITEELEQVMREKHHVKVTHIHVEPDSPES